jgi:hypothetical protein
MDQTPVIDILESRFYKKDDENVNQWYNEIHMPVLMKSNKVQSISIYKVREDSSEFIKYFIICKYGNQKDFEAFLASQEFREAGNDTPCSLKTFTPVHCELVKEWIR